MTSQVLSILNGSFFILADKKDNYISLNEFEFRPWPIMELAALEHLKK